MTGWTDLLQSLAKSKPEVKTVPPNVKYEDLWDHQQRIEKLEVEVQHLRSVLERILEQLQEREN